ncbi:MAG: ABC transporter ATP-binding protein [Candidatus Margulisiibacteriota bacterium]|jgi:iron complex transport system ATP-binding protein
MTALQVEKLTCGYDRKKPVSRELTFEVKDGEFVGIVGPNGCGKTTMLRTISGVLKPFAGSLAIGSQLVEHLDRRELARKVAFVPQIMEPVEGFTVEDMVMMGRLPYLERFAFESAEDYEAVNWAIEQLRIENLKGRMIDELSGGEFQRVMIARALAQEPKLLLLDEPTSHLDIRYQVKICKLMRRLRSHCSLLATFHDLNLASRFCTRLILMSRGEIVADGAPADVVTAENIWKVYRIKVDVKKSSKNDKVRYVLLP